jgi:glycosyltransferase involved in cell wall biosynthesis
MPTPFARAVESLIADPARRAELGGAAKFRARELFSADAIVSRYVQLYRRVCTREG